VLVKPDDVRGAFEEAKLLRSASVPSKWESVADQWPKCCEAEHPPGGLQTQPDLDGRLHFPWCGHEVTLVGGLKVLPATTDWDNKSPRILVERSRGNASERTLSVISANPLS